MRYERKRRHSSGAASVEAVVALPVFVVLFVGIFFLRDVTGARLLADQEVRRCSWQYSLQNNCSSAPRGCENVVGTGHFGDLMPKMEGLMNDLKDTMGAVGVSCSATGGCSIGGKAFKKVKRVLMNFVLDYLSQAVSKRFDANKAIEIERPGVFGGGTSVVRGKYGMACNIQVQTEDNVADLLWDEFGP